MTGPWERFQQAQQEEDGPWARFRVSEEARQTPARPFEPERGSAPRANTGPAERPERRLIRREEEPPQRQPAQADGRGFDAALGERTPNVDTTDDARAARGFGRSAYMDGLQDPGRGGISLPNLRNLEQERLAEASAQQHDAMQSRAEAAEAQANADRAEAEAARVEAWVREAEAAEDNSSAAQDIQAGLLQIQQWGPAGQEASGGRDLLSGFHREGLTERLAERLVEIDTEISAQAAALQAEREPGQPRVDPNLRAESEARLAELRAERNQIMLALGEGGIGAAQQEALGDIVTGGLNFMEGALANRELNEEISDIPMNPYAEGGFNEDASWGMTLRALAEDPYGVSRTFALRSAPASAPTIGAAIAGQFAGGPFGAGLAAGAATMSVERRLSLAQAIDTTFAEQGVDPSNQEQITAWVRENPNEFAGIMRHAFTRAAVIAGADAATAGVVGGIARSTRGLSPGSRAATAFGSGTILEPTGEATGEGLAQLLTEGRIIPGEVMAEAIGGLAMGGPSAVGQTIAEAMGSPENVPAAPRAPSPETPPEDDPERLNSPYLTDDDRASPLPNDALDDGLAALEEIEAGVPPEQQTAGLSASPQPQAQQVTPAAPSQPFEGAIAPPVMVGRNGQGETPNRAAPDRPAEPGYSTAPKQGAEGEALPQGGKSVLVSINGQDPFPAQIVRETLAGPVIVEPDGTETLLPTEDIEDGDILVLPGSDGDTETASAPQQAPAPQQEEPNAAQAPAPAQPEPVQVEPDEVAAPSDVAAGQAARQIEVLTNENLGNVTTDAETFQYKGGADAQGVTDRLRDVSRWNNNRTGMGLIYEYSDGRRVIVDGHQRFGLAQRLAASGQEVNLPVRVLRQIDGVTESDARAIGAEKNIAEGSGSALDAARVFRETRRTASELDLPMSSAMVRTADGLARLSDTAYGMVNNNVASERDGALVGTLVGNQRQHESILALLSRLNPSNATQAESIIRQAMDTEVRETQTSLFGEEEVSANLYMERAKVLDAAIKQLGRDVQTFRTLVERGETIAGEGNVLQGDANEARLTADAQTRTALLKQANTKGPISDALTEAARQFRDGGKLAAAARTFIERARDPESVAPADGAGSGGARSVDGPAQTARPGPDASEAQTPAVTPDGPQGGRTVPASDLFDQGPDSQPGERQTDLEDLISEANERNAAGAGGTRDGRNAADNPEAKPTYIFRQVLNADDIRAWAATQGFKSTLPADELHVTQVYAKDPVDRSQPALEARKGKVTSTGGRRSVETLGDEGAVVLRFQDAGLTQRWDDLQSAGATSDFDSYKAHITITYDASGVDLDAVEPYRGPIELGPEQVEDITGDFDPSSIKEESLEARDPNAAPVNSDVNNSRSKRKAKSESPAPSKRPVLNDSEKAKLDDILAQMSDKLRNQTNAGLDPEMVSLAVQAADIYVKAGVRRFRDFVLNLAEGLGLPVSKVGRYARIAYNDVRDEMEANGDGVADMDDSRAVIAELARLNLEEKENAPGTSTDLEQDRVAKPPQRIEDFGEKIGGAQKDKVRGWLARAAEVSDAEIATVPLSKSWPEPDYQALIDEGADPEGVAFMRAARDEVPNKPRSKWKVTRWAEQVRVLRDFASQIVSGDISMSDVRTKMAGVRALAAVEGRTDLYLEYGHEKSLKDITLSEGSYTVFMGERFDAARNVWTVRNKGRIASHGETKPEAIAAFADEHAKLGNLRERAKGVKFEIRKWRNGSTFIGKKVGKDWIEVETNPDWDWKEARAYLAENQEALEAKFKRMKELPPERGEENAPRVGTDHRNGQDVTPEMFTETFGFRGVQFGNYVEGPRRQADLNNAFDGLMDLAGVVNVPPKAMSLNGTLGLAFGARGSGRRASAHYEPGMVVINLTKGSGAGSLAHEWWHALDHYFSMQGGKKSSLLTETAGRGLDGNIRPEVVEAFKDLMSTVRQGELAVRSRQADKRRSTPYFSTMVEMTARSFESYVIGKLQDQSASNDYLANILSEDAWNAIEAMAGQETPTWPYVTVSEMPIFRQAFDNLFDVIQTEETPEGTVRMYQRQLSQFYSPLLRAVQNAKQRKAPAKDWQAILAKLPGVKQAEIEWLGVYDWLDSQEGAQVPRETLEQFIRDGQIQLVEERLAGDEDTAPDLSVEVDYNNAMDPDWEFEAEAYMDEARDEAIEEDPDRDPDDIPDEEIRDIADRIARERWEPTEFAADVFDDRSGEYVATGVWDTDMSEYRFPDLNASGKDEDIIEAAREYLRGQQFAGQDDIDGPARFPEEPDYNEPGGTDYREILLRVPNLHVTGRNVSRKTRADQPDVDGQTAFDPDQYTSVTQKRPFVQSYHFEQENIVVHARVKDRAGAQGERVLFVEEIQSDLASKWRENTESPEVTARRRSLQEERDRLSDERRNITGRVAAALNDEFEAAGVDGATSARMAVFAIEDRVNQGSDQGGQGALYANLLRQENLETYQMVVDLMRDRKAVNDELLRLGTERRVDPSTPDTPFKEEHTYTLMVKRLLREAAEKGYDRLSWTPGYMQAKRWNKAGQSVVERIEWEKSTGTNAEGAVKDVLLVMAGSNGNGGEYVVSVNDRGDIVDTDAAALEGKTLQSLIGPQLAKQILSEEKGTVSGQKITFPDSGYAIAYDQQTKRAVEKFAKKYGGRVYQDRTLPDMADTNASDVAMTAAIQEMGDQPAIERIVNALPSRLTDQARDRAGEALWRAVGGMDGPYRLSQAAVSQIGRAKAEAALGVAPKGNPVWSIDITPELRAAALEPMPILQEAAIETPDASLMDEGTLREILPELRASLDKMGLKRVRLGIGEDRAQQGVFQINRIGAMDILIGASLNPRATLYHESIHALRAINAFSDAEWSRLEAAATREPTDDNPSPNWIAKHRIAERYPDLSREQQIEEAIAEEFGEWASTGQAHSGGIRLAFEKIRRIMQAIAEALTGRGFFTAEDVFGRAISGEIMRRHAGNTGALRGEGSMDQRVPGLPDVGPGLSQPLPDDGFAAGGLIEFETTPEARDQAASLANDMRSELRKLGLPNIETRGVERLFAEVGEIKKQELDGVYFRGVITAALSSSRTWRQTVRHEAIHALRDARMWGKEAGLFRPAEWRALERYAKTQTEMLARVREAYPNDPESVILEEVIADLFADFMDGRFEPTGFVAAGMRAIRNALEAIGNALRGNGFTTAEAVFRRVGEGEVGRRQFEGRQRPEPALTASERPRDRNGRFVSRQAGAQGDLRPMFAARNFAPSGADQGGEGVRAGGTFSETALERIKALNALYGPPTQPTQLGLPPLFEVPHRRGIDRFREEIQDRFVMFGAVNAAIEKKTGEAVPDEIDFRLKQTLYDGRASSRLEKMLREEVRPITTMMKALKVSVDDIGTYLLAMHAKERNAEMARRDPDRFRDGNGSGLYDEAADALIEDFRDRGQLENLEQVAGKVRAMLDRDLNNRRASGLISQEQHQSYKDMYDHYVPLRGFAERDDAAQTGRIGRGFDIRGKEVREALGRMSISENPFVQAIAMRQEGIVRAEKNRVGRSLLKQVEKYPNPELWEQLGKLPMRKVFDNDTGMVREVVDFGVLKETEVIGVKVGGETRYVRIKDRLMAEAVKNLGTSDFGDWAPVMNTVARTTRAFSRLQTGGNPNFVFANAMADYAEGVWTAYNADTKGMVPSFVKNYPVALAVALQREVRNSAIGRGANLLEDSRIKKLMGQDVAEEDMSAFERYYEEWESSGGKINFMAFRDLDEITQDINDQIGANGRVNWAAAPFKAAEKALQTVEMVNQPIEHATRFAMFVSARQNGFSRERAAEMALDASGNYYRRGRQTRKFTTFYAFFNPAIQGMEKFARFSGKKKNWAIYAGLMTTAFALTAFNMDAWGDDDDPEGRPLYLQIPEWERSRSIIIPYGVEEEEVEINGEMITRQRLKYFSYRVPHNLRPLLTMGNEAAALAAGHATPEESIGAVNRSILMNTNPFGSESVWNMVAPTFADPFVDLAFNRSWTGAPIRPESQMWTEGRPRSNQYFERSNSDAAVWIAQAMNRLGGGDRFTPAPLFPGVFDRYPGELEYLYRYWSGGLGRFLSMSGEAALDAAQGVETDPNRVPILRSVMGRTNWYDAQGRYYDMRTEVFGQRNRARAAWAALEENPNDALAAETWERISTELNVYRQGDRFRWTQSTPRIFDRSDDLLRGIRDEIYEAQTNPSLSRPERIERERELTLQMEEIMRETMRVYLGEQAANLAAIGPD